MELEQEIKSKEPVLNLGIVTTLLVCKHMIVVDGKKV